MQTYSVREVIEMALQTEKLGFQFYTEMARRFEKEKGLKELFGTLADMETRHEKVFNSLFEKVRDEAPEGWDEAQSYMRAMVESKFFLGDKKSLPSMEHVKTVAEAVDTALRFEKESALFYLALRAGVRDKALVDDVIAEENRHIVWLHNYKETMK